MSTPLLSELREPPMVGRFYMVPAIFYPWLKCTGRPQWWPVAGPLHSDADFFQFDQPHYHADPRFFTAKQDDFVIRNKDMWPLAGDNMEWMVGRYPLACNFQTVPRGRPTLIRRKCRRSERGTYQFGDREPIMDLNRHYRGRRAGAEPIRLADKRVLCPHRKYDLSQHTPDERGLVICPLHGLKVRCGKRQLASIEKIINEPRGGG